MRKKGKKGKIFPMQQNNKLINKHSYRLYVVVMMELQSLRDGGYGDIKAVGNHWGTPAGEKKVVQHSECKRKLWKRNYKSYIHIEIYGLYSFVCTQFRKNTNSKA